MRYTKYFKNVEHLKQIDIYRVLRLFVVTDHELGHAVKKILLSGNRTGGKPKIVDITEAINSLTRWLDLEEEDARLRELKKDMPPINDNETCGL